MLCFEIVESGTAIQIYSDDDGLLLLRKALERVTSAGHLVDFRRWVLRLLMLLAVLTGGRALTKLLNAGKLSLGNVRSGVDGGRPARPLRTHAGGSLVALVSAWRDGRQSTGRALSLAAF